MGQRLNIEIHRKRDNKCLANCYYHWSAYTHSALRLTKEIVDNYTDFYKEKDDIHKAIKLLQSTGGGVVAEDFDKMSKEDQRVFALGQNRNLGLICFSEEEMQKTRDWEEGRVEITFGDEKDFTKLLNNFNDEVRIYFGVFFIEDEDYVKEQYKTEIKNGELDLNDLINFDFDYTNMTIDDIEEFLRRIQEIENDYMGLFRIKGQLYCAIF